VIALVFVYEVSEEDAFRRVYGAGGDWETFFRGGRGYVGTELLRDVEQAGRFLVVDRWDSRDAYNAFVQDHREEYMRRVDETVFLYDHELRLGTFETVWPE